MHDPAYALRCTHIHAQRDYNRVFKGYSNKGGRLIQHNPLQNSNDRTKVNIRTDLSHLIFEEIKKKKILALKEYGNTTYQNLWDTVEVVLKGKFMVLSAHIQKKKIENVKLILSQRPFGKIKQIQHPFMIEVMGDRDRGESLPHHSERQDMTNL